MIVCAKCADQFSLFGSGIISLFLLFEEVSYLVDDLGHHIDDSVALIGICGHLQQLYLSARDNDERHRLNGNSAARAAAEGIFALCWQIRAARCKSEGYL